MGLLQFSDENITKLACDAVAVVVLPERKLTYSGQLFNQKEDKGLQNLLNRESFRVIEGNMQIYFPKSPRDPKIILIAFPLKAGRLQELREASFKAVRAARLYGFQRLAIAFDPEGEEEIQSVGEGALLSSYEYRRFYTKKSEKPGLTRILICGVKKDRGGVKKAAIFASANLFVRDLVNEPPNVMNADRMLEVARNLSKKHSLKLQVFEVPQLRKMGANAFLSVGKGSDISTRMIVLSYRPGGKTKHVALIGKGLTFDSGGLSLKNEKGMEHMKSDMAGAATALATVFSARELNLPVSVTAIVMATENMPDGGANRPGDVIRAMNGKTIEITNTDAEGRLALADGLTFAQTLKPDYLIDIATLTGAQIIALGRLVGAVMGNDHDLAEKISKAGEKCGERMWPLPLIDRYRELIRSDIADIKNSSGIPDAGSIQGGLFLSEFVNGTPWVHLDIAGPSWQDRDWDVYEKNASGFGPRCILTFLSEI